MVLRVFRDVEKAIVAASALVSAVVDDSPESSRFHVDAMTANFPELSMEFRRLEKSLTHYERSSSMVNAEEVLGDAKAILDLFDPKLASFDERDAYNPKTLVDAEPQVWTQLEALKWAIFRVEIGGRAA